MLFMVFMLPACTKGEKQPEVDENQLESSTEPKGTNDVTPTPSAEPTPSAPLFDTNSSTRDQAIRSEERRVGKEC